MRTRIILIAAVAALAGCGDDGGKSSSGGRTVVAGFYPLAFVAKSVGGPGVSVRDMTPPGAEPHDLEISPRDVRDVEQADLVLLLGRGFQPQLERAAGDSDKVVKLLDTPGVDPFPDGDPHVWLDPVRLARIAENVAPKLGRPGGARSLVARLHSLDGEFRDGLADCRRHDVVTSHEAFRYLAGRYGLRQVAISGVSPESEPSPAALQRAVDAVERTGATTVFSEPLVSKRLANTVAKETGARVDVLDPIEVKPAGTDYFGVMRSNLARLRRGLSCR